MYRRLVSFTYLLNALIQGLFSLLFPIGVGVLGAWLLVTRCGVGDWIYVVLILCGVGVGLYSACRFLIQVFQTIDRLEAERKHPTEKR